MNTCSDHLLVWLSLLIPALAVFSHWDGVWKTFGISKSACDNQRTWLISAAKQSEVRVLHFEKGCASDGEPPNRLTMHGYT